MIPALLMFQSPGLAPCFDAVAMQNDANHSVRPSPLLQVLYFYESTIFTSLILLRVSMTLDCPTSPILCPCLDGFIDGQKIWQKLEKNLDTNRISTAKILRLMRWGVAKW
jgi:hypothetical protein